MAIPCGPAGDGANLRWISTTLNTPKPNHTAAPRLLILPPTCFAHQRTVGGGERYALEYARTVARRIPTTLALFDTKPGLEKDGDLTIRTFTLRDLGPGKTLHLTPETRAALRDYDLVHLMWFPTPAGDSLMLSALWNRQPVVLTSVGGGLPCWSTRLVRLGIRGGLYRFSAGVAHLSRHAASLETHWRCPQTILFGGADLGKFNLAQRRFEGYALFVGRLLQHKGVLELVQAVSPTTPLRLVGRPYDPAYFEALKAAAAGKQVRFITDADDAELQRQIGGANVVLQPSIPIDPLAELLGLVTIEGMASGKPVIVTRTTSLPELVQDGETGFVVPPYEAEPLRRRIDECVRDPALAQRLGDAGRRHVESHFTWERTAGRGLELYRRIRPGNARWQMPDAA
jgi:glycosyltransferase involved in cell wall biosynthesis